MFKRKVWEKYQFNEELGGYEDWDWNLRAIENGFIIKAIDIPLVNISDVPNSRNKGSIRRHNELKEKICS